MFAAGSYRNQPNGSFERAIDRGGLGVATFGCAACGLPDTLWLVTLPVGKSYTTSVFDKARTRIVDELKSDDANAIATRVRSIWAKMGGAGAPLRPELVHAFASGGSTQVKSELSAVSPTARLRNGLQYLDFALAVLAAAGIDHLFLMIDQLEDLATNRSVTASKRSREIGRIRDLLESNPYATRLHMRPKADMVRRITRVR